MNTFLDDFGTDLSEKVKCFLCGKSISKTSAHKVASFNEDLSSNGYVYYCKECHYFTFIKPVEDFLGPTWEIED